MGHCLSVAPNEKGVMGHCNFQCLSVGQVPTTKTIKTKTKTKTKTIPKMKIKIKKKKKKKKNQNQNQNQNQKKYLYRFSFSPTITSDDSIEDQNNYDDDDNGNDDDDDNDDNDDNEEEGSLILNYNILYNELEILGPPIDNEDTSEFDDFKHTIEQVFWAFNGYSNFKKNNIYLQRNEVYKFLELCNIIEPSPEIIFKEMDCEIVDNCISYNEFVNYFCDPNTNPGCYCLQKQLQEQPNFQILKEALRILYLCRYMQQQQDMSVYMENKQGKKEKKKKEEEKNKKENEEEEKENDKEEEEEEEYQAEDEEEEEEVKNIENIEKEKIKKRSEDYRKNPREFTGRIDYGQFQIFAKQLLQFDSLQTEQLWGQIDVDCSGDIRIDEIFKWLRRQLLEDLIERDKVTGALKIKPNST